MKVAVIYLAAGNSKRFGANKLLYEMENKPMYLHLLERLRHIVERHEDWKLVVVTQYEEVLEREKGQAGTIIYSKDSRNGISYSIKAGLAQTEEAEAYAFFVADQPFLSEKSAEGFLQKMEEEQASLGCVSCEMHTGNPTWFSKEYRQELEGLKGDKGGKSILKCHLDEVCFYQIKDKRELEDIDEYPV